MTNGTTVGYDIPGKEYWERFERADTEDQCAECKKYAPTRHWIFTDQRLCRECLENDLQLIKEDGDEDTVKAAIAEEDSISWK